MPAIAPAVRRNIAINEFPCLGRHRHSYPIDVDVAPHAGRQADSLQPIRTMNLAHYMFL
jgi:hypothetical protein